MALVATSVKVEKDKLELAKLKGANVSQLTRDAIDSYLKLSSNDRVVIQGQIDELLQQRISIDLELKLLMNLLETSEHEEIVQGHRETMYEKRKQNLAYMHRTKSLDWRLIASAFKFNNVDECRSWVLGRLAQDELIQV